MWDEKNPLKPLTNTLGATKDGNPSCLGFDSSGYFLF